ncbi:MAG: aspartate 1-decarboxylase [Chthonomonadaceae bacterium]|nr:aspartate 1-decarboxylase [Chthonomonadaceae bacterium]
MRLKQLLKAKIHHATVTYANPDYVGSIEIDGELLKRVGIEDGELVHVWAVDHTSRIVTYAFSGPSGVVGLNGGAAHHFSAGDRVVIAAFCMTDEPVEPVVVLVNEGNQVVRDMSPFCVTG